MHIAAAMEINSGLIPKLKHLHTTLHSKVQLTPNYSSSFPSASPLALPFNCFDFPHGSLSSGIFMHQSAIYDLLCWALIRPRTVFKFFPIEGNVSNKDEDAKGIVWRDTQR